MKMKMENEDLGNRPPGPRSSHTHTHTHTHTLILAFFLSRVGPPLTSKLAMPIAASHPISAHTSGVPPASFRVRQRAWLHMRQAFAAAAKARSSP